MINAETRNQVMSSLAFSPSGTWWVHPDLEPTFPDQFEPDWGVPEAYEFDINDPEFDLWVEEIGALKRRSWWAPFRVPNRHLGIPRAIFVAWSRRQAANCSKSFNSARAETSEEVRNAA